MAARTIEVPVVRAGPCGRWRKSLRIFGKFPRESAKSTDSAFASCVLHSAAYTGASMDALRAEQQGAPIERDEL
jgi:hypothetical protein